MIDESMNHRRLTIRKNPLAVCLLNIYIGLIGMKRKLYEKINLNIYIVVPIIGVLIYLLLYFLFDFQLSDFQKFNLYSFDCVLAMLIILLIVLGLTGLLPENRYRKMMRRYRHEQILYNTILCGLVSSLFFIFIFFIGKITIVQDALFIITFCETTIATIWILRTLRAIYK